MAALVIVGRLREEVDVRRFKWLKRFVATKANVHCRGVRRNAQTVAQINGVICKVNTLFRIFVGIYGLVDSFQYR